MALQTLSESLAITTGSSPALASEWPITFSFRWGWGVFRLTRKRNRPVYRVGVRSKRSEARALECRTHSDYRSLPLATGDAPGSMALESTEEVQEGFASALCGLA